MTRIIAVLLAGFLVGIGYFGFRFLSAGPGSEDEQVVFLVPGGRPFSATARELQDKGLVLDSNSLRILAKVMGLDRRIKRGEYLLNRAMTPQQILRTLITGQSIMYPVTFPEGTNIFEVGKILEEKGFFKAADFVSACRDKELIQRLLGIDVSSLEGYLFPETYNLTKFTTIHELLAQMVQNFNAVYKRLEEQAGAAPGLSRHELVTLASIVEKETGAPDERPHIASVFYNRLSKNMRLQSDPTIVYGIWVETGAYKSNITREDIVRPTPYNTYTVAKLPFGPIANPGRDALAAVFTPSMTDDLYFVSRNNGTHIFSKSYEQHTRAVREFQLNPSAREGHSWRELEHKK